MEETNAWLDPESGSHNNKKSTKPDPRPAIKAGMNTPATKPKKLVPGKPKTDDEKISSYLETLVEDGLNPNLPKSVKDWAIENFDEEWLNDFLKEIEVLKDELLSSHYYPSHEKMLMLKYIFLLQRGF